MDPAKKPPGTVLTRSERPAAASPEAAGPVFPEQPEPTFPTRLHPGITPPPSPAADEIVGRVLAGRFRIEKRLGSGGMGAIYLARQLDVDRPVAVKVAHPDLAAQPKKVERFRREGIAIAQLNHPHVVQLYLTGETEDGLLYLVMELVRGRTLSEELRACDRMPQRRAVRIALQIADTLAHAHTLGIVHRDLKPANIMLVEQRDEPDFVKVLDFGIAKLLDTPEELRLTRTGARLGTPPYMAPEQVKGQHVDGRADIYSLGLILYEMIAGERPYRADNALQYYAQHLQGEPPTLPSERHPDLVVLPELEQVLERCLQKDRDQRYPTADALHEDLRRVERRLESASDDSERPAPPTLATAPRPSRRALWAGLLLAAVVAATTAWAVLDQVEPASAVREVPAASSEASAPVPPQPVSPVAPPIAVVPTAHLEALEAPVAQAPAAEIPLPVAGPTTEAHAALALEAPTYSDAWLPPGALEVHRTLNTVLYRSPLPLGQTFAAYRRMYGRRLDFLVTETTVGEHTLLSISPAGTGAPFRTLTVTPAELNPAFSGGGPLIAILR